MSTVIYLSTYGGSSSFFQEQLTVEICGSPNVLFYLLFLSPVPEFNQYISLGIYAFSTTEHQSQPQQYYVLKLGTRLYPFPSP
jgi:hypothetical protein